MAFGCALSHLHFSCYVLIDHAEHQIFQGRDFFLCQMEGVFFPFRLTAFVILMGLFQVQICIRGPALPVDYAFYRLDDFQLGGGFRDKASDPKSEAPFYEELILAISKDDDFNLRHINAQINEQLQASIDVIDVEEYQVLTAVFQMIDIGRIAAPIAYDVFGWFWQGGKKLAVAINKQWVPIEEIRIPYSGVHDSCRRTGIVHWSHQGSTRPFGHPYCWVLTC